MKYLENVYFEVYSLRRKYLFNLRESERDVATHVGSYIKEHVPDTCK